VPVDSIPRFAWGRFTRQGERMEMALGVQAHHGFVDGLHAGVFYEHVQEYLDEPQSILD
jgi:chloramphenicol O-acetyltransferase